MSNKAKTTAVGKCRARTKAGRQCAAPAVRGGAYCAIHADPDRAAVLGRKGGARNRKMYHGEIQEVTRRFRTHSTGITETIQQKELQAPPREARPGLPAPTTEAGVSQAKQEDEVVILDY